MNNRFIKIMWAGVFMLLIVSGMYAQKREVISHRFLVVRISQDNKFGLEANGVQILPVQYKSIEYQRDNDNLFVVEEQSGKLGVVNNRGVFVVAPGNYKKIVFNEASILLYKDNVTYDSESRHRLKSDGLIDFITSPVDKFKWTIPMSDDGELFRRILPDNTYQLYTKDGVPILECKSIMKYYNPEWGGYKFFIVGQESGKGLIMYKDGKYYYTIEPVYDVISQATVIGDRTRYLTYVVSASKGYQEERYYMDGRPSEGHVRFKLPFIPEVWKMKEAATKTYQVSIGKTSKSGLGIKSVTKAYDYTEIEFTYTEKKKDQGLYLNQNGEEAFFIRVGGEKNEQIKIMKDIDHKIKVGQTTSFIIRFFPLPDTVQQFDILEGPHGEWNYYNVTLKQ